MNPKKKLYSTFLIVSVIVQVIIFCILFFCSAFTNKNRLLTVYRSGIDSIEKGDYQTGLATLNPLGNYKDSFIYERIASFYLDYENKVYVDEEELQSRIDLLSLYEQTFSDQTDSEDTRKILDSISKLKKILNEQINKEQLYTKILSHFQNKQYVEAIYEINKLGNYRDSSEILNECINARRLELSKTISAGIRFSASIKEGGGVNFSGIGYAGKKQVESWNDIVSIFVMGEFTMGLKEDGTVITTNGGSKFRVNTSEWKDIVAISAGQQYIVGLKADGTLTAQGIDGYGETKVDGSDWKDIVAIDTGWQHTVGLDKSGDILITGYHSDNLISALEREKETNKEAWSDIVAISTGGSSSGYDGEGHIVALKKDGTVLAVAADEERDKQFAQWKVDDWCDIVAISAGDYHTVGLKSDGTVVTTQSKELFGDSYDEISKWRDIVAVSAGCGFTLGLKSDGTVVSAGLYKDGQRDTASWGKTLLHVDRIQ